MAAGYVGKDFALVPGLGRAFAVGLDGDGDFAVAELGAQVGEDLRQEILHELLLDVALHGHLEGGGGQLVAQAHGYVCAHGVD